jgi:hypothetical protein
MVTVNLGFGGILERVILKVKVEIAQWSGLGEKSCDSLKTLQIVWYQSLPL